jgi:cell division protein YceG involved in septum cleavage
MREAFGGSWLLGFVAFFIVLLSSYLAISVNYSKAFKTKNQIINIIENNEGFTANAEEEIDNVLRNGGYYITSTFSCNNNQGTFQAGGYCLKTLKGTGGTYYKVTTFIVFNMPLVEFTVKIPITGETKTIFFNK